MNPTWKNTFNVTLYYANLGCARLAAEGNGYPYFSWNGLIYNVFCQPTGLTVEDLDQQLMVGQVNEDEDRRIRDLLEPTTHYATWQDPVAAKTALDGQLFHSQRPSASNLLLAKLDSIAECAHPGDGFERVDGKTLHFESGPPIEVPGWIKLTESGHWKKWFMIYGSNCYEFSRGASREYIESKIATLKADYADEALELPARSAYD